jgi:glycosyltransferase involved in cell wall biosynthesis
MDMKICIVIPAHNEEKRIVRTLDEYCGFFSGLNKKIDFEILVVINNTNDRTESIVRTFQKNCKELRCLNFKQGGKGFAVIEGFKDALKRENDFIGFVDADMSTSPSEFYRICTRIGQSDGAIASRYLKGSVVKPKPTFSRILSSRIFNFLIRVLFLMPYQDTQCGAKIFRREAVKEVLSRLSMSKWAFDVDLLYSLRKLGFEIKEIPSVWSDRGYSKINFMSAGPWMAIALVRLWLYNSPFKGVVKIYNKITDFVYRRLQ